MNKEEILKRATDEWLVDNIARTKCGHSGVLIVGEDLEDTSQWIKISTEEIEHEYNTRHLN